jgi:adenosylhomocysteine nucleosidase
MSNTPSAASHCKDQPVVLVCFAVREEARFFKPPVQPSTEVLVTGIGVRNTAQALANYLAAQQPRLVLTCGFAGGLNPVHPLGQVLFDATDAGEFGFDLTRSGALPGRFTHSDRVVVTSNEKAQLYKTTGADAVEMESSAIVKVCRERGIPVIVLRVISDTATDELPMDFNLYATAGGGLSLPRLLLGIAGSPGSIPKLLQFQRRLKHAAKSLGARIERFLGSENLF